MKIQDESYSIVLPDSEFVRIDYSATVTMAWGPRPSSATVWFERANLPWVVRTLRDCITIYGLAAQRTTSGHDSLSVDESGPEPAPFINIANKRRPGVPHEGAYWISLTKPLAEKLLADLERLR